MEITLTLPEELLQRATLWADHLGRPLHKFLEDTIDCSLKPLNGPKEAPISTWSDHAILAAADADMPKDKDQRLSMLLDRQQAGLLTAAEQTELEMLMQYYQVNLLRKALALREAVKRGLRERLTP